MTRMTEVLFGFPDASPLLNVMDVTYDISMQ